MNKFEYVQGQINEKIAKMSVMVCSMYKDAVKAMRTNDIELARAVVGKDKDVDGLDVDIDEYCLRILALFCPKAQELRYVVSALRIIIDLERVGDHCKEMARQVETHNLSCILNHLEGFEELAEKSYQMLDESINLFFRCDETGYNSIIKRDKEIGALQRKLNKSLILLIAEDKERLEEIVSLVTIIRRMERIADHSKNIAELVPYIQSGRLMRHKGLLEE